VCYYQNLTNGSLGLENYPVYFPLIEAFTDGEMQNLVQIITGAFVILADGIPKVYYGQEQHMTGNYSPFNREALWDYGYNTDAPLYNLTATLNALRNHAIKTDSRYVANHSIPLYSDNSTFATRKGPDGVQIVSVFSNQGSKGGAYQLVVPGAAQPGTNLTEVFNCTTVTANSAGNITVDMGAGLPKVFFPTFNLNGTGLCNSSKNATASTGSGATSTKSGSTASSTKKGGAEQLQMHPLSLLVGGVVALGFWLL